MSKALIVEIVKTRYAIPLSLCVFGLAIVMAGAFPLMPLYLTQDFGLNKTELTTFFMIHFVASLLVTFISGYISDGLVKRHRLVLISGCIAMIGYVCLALVQTRVNAYFSGALTVFVIVLFPQFFAVARNNVFQHLEEHMQVVVTTYLRILFSLGYVFGPVLLGVLASELGYRKGFIAIAAMTLSLAVCGYLVLRKIALSKQRSSQLEKSSSSAASSSSSLSWVVIPPLLAVILMRGGDSTRSIYMPLVVVQMFNDPLIATTLFSITAFAELFFMGYIAYVATKIGEKKTIMIGTVVGAVYFLLMANTTSLLSLYLLQVLYAIFVATLLGVAMAYTQSLIKERAGFAASLYMNAIQLGSALGYVSPLLIEGITQKVFYISAILCIIVVFVLSIQRRKENSNEKIGMGY